MEVLREKNPAEIDNKCLKIRSPWPGYPSGGSERSDSTSETSGDVGVILASRDPALDPRSSPVPSSGCVATQRAIVMGGFVELRAQPSQAAQMCRSRAGRRAMLGVILGG